MHRNCPFLNVFGQFDYRLGCNIIAASYFGCSTMYDLIFFLKTRIRHFKKIICIKLKKKKENYALHQFIIHNNLNDNL